MEVNVECGTCTALLLTRTLSHRTSAEGWRPHFGPALAQAAGVMAGAQHPGVALDRMYQALADRLQDGDPYAAAKDDANRRMEAWWAARAPGAAPGLAELLAWAVAGNAIDAGVDPRVDTTWQQFTAAAAEPLAHDDRSQAVAWVAHHPGARVLYLLDNAGEAVLDRECMRALSAAGLAVTAVVKGGPILNDVTRREADALRLADVARVWDTGAARYGTMRGRVAAAVWAEWEAADLVVAKGLAHLETLSHEPRSGPVLFLYRAKCPPSARLLSVPPESSVAWWRPPAPASR